MTDDDFESALRQMPNGLHDAKLLSLKVDLERAELNLEVDACWGGSEFEDPEERRRARVRLFALRALIIERIASADEAELAPEMIDGGQGTPPKLAPLGRGEDEFEFWVFLSRSNSFIRGVAKRCEVETSQ